MSMLDFSNLANEAIENAEFFGKWHKRPKFRVEINTGEYRLDLTGYIGDNARLAALMKAGVQLAASRGEPHYDSLPGDKIRDEDIPINPTTTFGFEQEEADMLASAVSERLEAQASAAARKVVDAKEAQKADSASDSGAASADGADKLKTKQRNAQEAKPSVSTSE